MLKSGIPWEMLPQEMGCGSGMTCWRRLRDWQETGIWDAFHHALLDRLGRAGLIDWSRCSLDAASLPAKAGGAHTGPNPTDRGKPGSKRHIVVDRQGIPLAVLLTAANVHDSVVLEDLIDRIPAIRKPRGRPNCTPTRATITRAVAGRWSSARSSYALLDVALRARSAWADTAGWSSVHEGSAISVSQTTLRQNDLRTWRSGSPTLALKVERAPADRCGRRPFPQEIARQADVFPADRRRVGKQFIRHRLSLRTKVLDGIGHVGGVPIDDGGDQQVQSGGPVFLCLRAAIGNPALLEGTDRLGQGMTLFSLVEAGVAAPPQFRALQPVEHYVESVCPAESS